MQSDSENLARLNGAVSVDNLNRQFYSRFPYPWSPAAFPRLADRDFGRMMLCQDMGDYTHTTFPKRSKIWVAGCGTNQAIYTALRFPDSKVIASDISPSSLRISRQVSDSLGLTNLTLREESLNNSQYDRRFDYIVCTGVIHHTANPAEALSRIGKALKPNGILELMVYNRYHRSFASSFQKAVRLLLGAPEIRSLDEELTLAKSILSSNFCSTREDATDILSASESYIADLLLQPVEFSYTVESLAALADYSQLSLVAPCCNQFDAAAGRSWYRHAKDQALRARLNQLPDILRWQVINLLLQDDSPMLWFFLQHKDAMGTSRTEAIINERFLQTHFRRSSTELKNYVKNRSFAYCASDEWVPYPARSDDGTTKNIVALADGTSSMAAILNKIGVDTNDLTVVSEVRTRTTTSQYPYLTSVT